MAYTPNNPNGQATSANSSPYVIASDQSTVPVFKRFTYSTLNTSVVQLAASATFTGSIEAIPNDSTYSLLVIADQNLTIIINQYIDVAGLKRIMTQSFPYIASSEFAISYPLNGNFVNVVVTNTGPSTTTNFECNLAFGDIQSSNRFGHLPVMQDDVNITGAAATTNTANNNALLQVIGTSPMDVSGFRSGTVQIVTTSTGGTYIFEESNTGINWQNMTVVTSTATNGSFNSSTITASSSSIIYHFQIKTRFIRLRIVTNITGGGSSIVANTRLSQTPYANLVNQTVQMGGNTVAVGGQTGHSTNVSSNPVQSGGRVVPITIATTDTTLVAADCSYLPLTTGLQAITKNFSTSELDYNISFSSISSNITIQPLVPASGTTNVRNYITSLILQTDTLGTTGLAWILDLLITGASAAIGASTWTNTGVNGLIVGDAIIFTSLGTITGFATNTVYYVVGGNGTTTMQLSTTINGSALNTGGVTSAYSCYRVLYQFRLQTTSTNYQINFTNPLKGNSNGLVNFLLPVSLTSGNIYLGVGGYRGF